MISTSSNSLQINLTCEVLRILSKHTTLRKIQFEPDFLDAGGDYSRILPILFKNNEILSLTIPELSLSYYNTNLIKNVRSITTQSFSLHHVNAENNKIFTKLERLKLYKGFYANIVSSHYYNKIAPYLSNLRILIFRDVNLNESHFLTRFVNLDELVIDRCYNLTSHFLLNLQYCEKLKNFSILNSNTGFGENEFEIIGETSIVSFKFSFNE